MGFRLTYEQEEMNCRQTTISGRGSWYGGRLVVEYASAPNFKTSMAGRQAMLRMNVTIQEHESWRELVI
jgi:hypothetical protein